MRTAIIKQQKIISLLLEKGTMSSSGVHEEMVKKREPVSLVTIKRMLSEMVVRGVLVPLGKGRSAAYEVSTIGRIFSDIDARQYCAIEPDKRWGMHHYNFDLFPALSGNLFVPDELQILDSATGAYKERIRDLSPVIQKKELERLIIELSWKSSKIEGNTYTLLDTEKLILENKEAAGHDKKEMQMILNHKDAFAFVHKERRRFRTLTRAGLERVHALLVKDLGVNFGLRKKPVGVLGSAYRPLDNIHQISESVDALGAAVSRMTTPYAKAFITLLGLSYVQPFEDGNKRTARLAANAVLLAHDCAPLSYRSLDENEYREALLVFYEINSIVPFKNIFIGQYDFAARNYAVA